MGAQGICIEAQGLRRGYVVLGYNGSINPPPPKKTPQNLTPFFGLTVTLCYYWREVEQCFTGKYSS